MLQGLRKGRMAKEAVVTTVAESITSRKEAPSVTGADRLRRRIRAEFLEMPGLKLTLNQAARIFGVDARRSTRLLEELVDEGFLARDARGAFRRQTELADWAPDAEARCDHPTPTTPAPRLDDVLEAIGIEFPCLACGGSYRIPLRKIRLSQQMMDEGCQVRHFADCPPGAFAHLVDPAVLARFEAAVRQIQAAAEDAGGHLVGPDPGEAMNDRTA
jgi:hypothetical protein